MDDRNKLQPYDNWATETPYTVGKRVRGQSGNWECLVAHTSGTGTMTDDIAANPGHWKAI